MVFLILGAWELAFHLWMMDLPMLLGHRLNALIGTALVAAVVLATFALIQRYEQRLAVAVRALNEKNEALRTLDSYFAVRTQPSRSRHSPCSNDNRSRAC
jgi:hypothetical protein